jgi:hypothetical protein
LPEDKRRQERGKSGVLEYWINDALHGKTISSSFSIIPTLHYSKHNSTFHAPYLRILQRQTPDAHL